MAVSFLIQVTLLTFSSALVSMALVIGQINRYSVMASPLRYFSLGFFFLALNNFFSLLSTSGTITIPYGYEASMFLTIVSFLMAMLRYSKMADRYKND